MATTTSLRNLAPNLWVADRPFKLPFIFGDIRTRMTVIRLANGSLFLHSPILLDPETRAALDEIGAVREIVAPSKAHHLFVGEYLKAYPEAKLHGAPDLSSKRKDLTFTSILGDEADPDWQGQIEHHLFGGTPFLNEIVFYHPATHTLIFTDLVFNVSRQDAAQARVFNWISGAAGHFGPHRLVRRAITDHEAARVSVARILQWDFDRVIVTHGDVLESGGRDRVRAAFAYL